LTGAESWFHGIILPVTRTKCGHMSGEFRPGSVWKRIVFGHFSAADEGPVWREGRRWGEEGEIS